MHSQIATEAGRQRVRHPARAAAVLGIGPAVVLAGLVWALLQPYRVTLLHPYDQGFWWLFVEPPLWVILVGAFFHAFVAPGLVSDLEETDG